MREQLVRHEIIRYQDNEPFYISNATKADAFDEYASNSHWHEELEIAYTLRGHHYHIIDGERVEAEPGRVIVTNCESVHRISANLDEYTDPDAVNAIVLIIDHMFIETNFPEYRNIWFTNEKRQARQEVKDIMMEFSEYRDREAHDPYDHIYMRGLVLQLLYYLILEGSVDRSDEMLVKQHEQVQVIRDILQYIEENYREPLLQSEVAKVFYFTPQYFSRLFKRYTGITFTDHLNRYRVEQARQELINTDRRILDIALDNGFHDSRGFINAFKSIYHTTPLQYKKELISH